MKIYAFFLLFSVASGVQVFSQSKVVTTGNNTFNGSDPYAADIVIGSDVGTRHDGSIMWWSIGSASRISNTGDVFYLSVWNTVNPNIGLSATMGGSSYFQGNVGIGSTSPNTRFQVNSDNNGTGQGNWIAGNFGGTAGDRVVMGILNGVATIGSHNNALNAWSTLAINPDSYGNVGIGTSDAHGHRLAVNGDIIATAVTVKQYANSPDYVLKSSYQLPTLDEIKHYIDKNGHLPDIPSATEVTKNGIDLGEMNSLLLKKVEELTLYLIENDKKEKQKDGQMKRLQHQIDQLKSTKQSH